MAEDAEMVYTLATLATRIFHHASRQPIPGVVLHWPPRQPLTLARGTDAGVFTLVSSASRQDGA